MTDAPITTPGAREDGSDDPSAAELDPRQPGSPVASDGAGATEETMPPVPSTAADPVAARDPAAPAEAGAVSSTAADAVAARDPAAPTETSLPPTAVADPGPAAAGGGSPEPEPTTDTPPPLREPDEAALRLAEAIVFASVTPVTARGLSQLLPDDMDAAAVIAALRLRYEGRGIELLEIGGGLRFRTAPDLAPHLRKVVQVPRRLPRVALETLAIVAYHQPITRPEIEDIRGTGLSQQTLDVLLENDLIVARGRKETPGRPTLWGTTAKFLEYFGLRDIRELPRRQDLLLEAVRPETPAEASADPDAPR